MQTILDNQFSDLDQLKSRTSGWDLDFYLMQKGGFHGRLQQAASRDALLTYADFNCKLHQAGTTPPGFRTFALPTAGCHGFWWLGYWVDHCSVMRFGADNELACVSDTDFSVFTVSIRDAFFDRHADALGLACAASDRGVTQIAPGQMRHLQLLAETAVFDSLPGIRSLAVQRLSELLLVYCTDGRRQRRPSPRRRDQAIRRVIEFLDQHGAQQPSLSDMCRIAHVSERTLQYAFRERYGISPNRFVRYWQLNAAHRRIKSPAGNGRTVAAIASDCGFPDASLFARHYRQMHGELPSKTLSRLTRK